MSSPTWRSCSRFLLAGLEVNFPDLHGASVVIGADIGRSGVGSGFVAAGSLVVVLPWVYFSAQNLLVGAEFTCVYARTFGSRSAGPRALWTTGIVELAPVHSRAAPHRHGASHRNGHPCPPLDVRRS